MKKFLPYVKKRRRKQRREELLKRQLKTITNGRKIMTI